MRALASCRSVLGALAAVCALALQMPCATLAFWGSSSSSSSDIVKSGKTGCVTFQQTGGCDPNGPAEDMKPCRSAVPRGSSGFCKCTFGNVAEVGCGHRRFTCEQMCQDEFPKGECDDESLAWFPGTKWHWNNWREVSFEHDGTFRAPTPDCQSGGCSWSCADGKVFIAWGDAGLHTVKPEGGKDARLEGIRFDGDACSATFTGRLPEPQGGSVVAGSGSSDDLYEMLGVDYDATEADIKKRFRKLSRTLHPDRVQGDKKAAEEKFNALREAYEVLSDPDLRILYDTGGMEAVDEQRKQKAGGSQAMDPFSMFFGGGQRESRGKRGTTIACARQSRSKTCTPAARLTSTRIGA